MLKGTVSVPAAAVLFLTTAPAHGQRALPDGIGKSLVESVCTRCHGASQIIGSVGYTQQEWRQIFGSMVALPRHRPPPSRLPRLALPAQGGPVPGRAGRKRVGRNREWMLPTLGQRPHDPEFDEVDGSVWWTGQSGRPTRQARPRDRRHGGVSPPVRRAPARPRLGRRRQHLVHRQRRRARREARHADGGRDRLSDHRP